MFNLTNKNFSSKIFLVKRWDFWTCFLITKGGWKKVHGCDLNTCIKNQWKQTLKFWKPWIRRKFFWFFLVLTRDRNNFQTKMSLSRHRNLKFNKFKIFVGNCDLKKKIKFEEFKSAQICNVFFEMSEFSIWKNLSWNYT